MLGELRKKSESQMGCKPTTKKSAHFGKIGKKTRRAYCRDPLTVYK